MSQDTLSSEWIVPDGIYDSNSSHCRELYHGGRIVAVCGMDAIQEVRKTQVRHKILNSAWYKAWGSYPDVPKKEKK